MNKEILIKGLKSKKINYYDIPSELENDNEIIEAERISGMRVCSNRGYDIISNNFFIEEDIIDFADNSILKTITTNFKTFDEYYNYLQGDIYEKSCYYQYSFTSNQIKKYKLDTNKLNFIALIDYTIEDDDYYKNELLNLSNEYKNTELIKEKNKIWINKVLKCKNLDELLKVLKNFKKSKYYNCKYDDILIYYLIKDNPTKAFKILMDSINNCEYIISSERMCLYFSTKDVLDTINYNKNKGAKTTLYRYLNKLKKFANNIDNNNYEKTTKCKFDIQTNYFIIENSYKVTDFFSPFIIRKYFYDIKEFINYLNGDLSNCDLSKANISNNDLKECITNQNTILPLNTSEISCIVNKYYDYENNEFIVLQKWIDKNENIVLKRKNEYKYFFDFIYFLKNDLSNADLIFCDGLLNLKSSKDINLNNAHIKSKIMDKLGLSYKSIPHSNNPLSFKQTIENEKNTQLALNEKRELPIESIDYYKNYKKISYVSDIHLMHRLKKCKSIYDIEFIIRDVINNILNDSSGILLIGGDISSDFNFYKRFITELSKKIKNNYKYIKVIFILGNHELWDFENKKMREIVHVYKNLIFSNGMYFIHNNLLYIEENHLKEISEEEINILSYNEIRDRLKKSNLIISGGLGFSGYNNEFNANNGIYKYTINRKQEINESKKFEKIYNKLTNCIKDKNVIIFTHTPKKDWSNSEEYIKNWVYVSGHTHRNYFYDDGEYRIYSDNQLGYNYKIAFSKSFYIEYTYDIFSDYKDGIYTITKDEYKDFYRGKNIMMDYNRDGNLFMLKKNGYYCFIRQTAMGYSILNGGASTQLRIDDINYYYNNMDRQIIINKEPLDKYTKYQKNIADYIKKIGGSGKIHGSIIDIDFYNHIYVNPFDGTISGYYAYNIIDKYVYNNIPSLLKANCPLLYENYKKESKNSKSNALILKGQPTEINLKSTYFPNTDIYKASREIKKMQKLNKGILTVWYDDNRYFLN